MDKFEEKYEIGGDIGLAAWFLMQKDLYSRKFEVDSDGANFIITINDENESMDTLTKEYRDSESYQHDLRVLKLKHMHKRIRKITS